MKESEFLLRTDAIKARLYKMAYLYLGSEALALDALDEGIYKALTHLRQLREDAFFETWLTRIIINECNKELRRRKREATQEIFDTTYTERFDSLPLKEALLHLPTELRSVIILRYFSGYTLHETAQALQIPQGTVTTRQRKALQILRLELEEAIV